MISAGSMLSGIIAQPKIGTYPMRMVVENLSKCKISGFLCWPSIHYTRTKFVGKIHGNEITFTEYEVISGYGVALPNLYKGHINSQSMMLSGICQHANEQGTFFMEALPLETSIQNCSYKSLLSLISGLFRN